MTKILLFLIDLAIAALVVALAHCWQQVFVAEFGAPMLSYWQTAGAITLLQIALVPALFRGGNNG